MIWVVELDLIIPTVNIIVLACTMIMYWNGYLVASMMVVVVVVVLCVSITKRPRSTLVGSEIDGRRNRRRRRWVDDGVLLLRRNA